MPSYFLISRTVVMEYQMLVEAGNLAQAQIKALAPENQDQWRELAPRQMMTVESVEEEQEYPEVVE